MKFQNPTISPNDYAEKSNFFDLIIFMISFSYDFLFLYYRPLRKKISINQLNFLSSILFSSIIYIIMYFVFKEKLESISKFITKPHASLLLLPVITYWHLDNRYGNKWRYCANLFNKHLELKTNAGSSKSYCKVRQGYFTSTLCIDIYEMKLEHDKILKSFYKGILDLSKECLIDKHGNELSDIQYLKEFQKIKSIEVNELNLRAEKCN